jgi:hypothetical protein
MIEMTEVFGADASESSNFVKGTNSLKLMTVLDNIKKYQSLPSYPNAIDPSCQTLSSLMVI